VQASLARSKEVNSKLKIIVADLKSRLNTKMDLSTMVDKKIETNILGFGSKTKGAGGVKQIKILEYFESMMIVNSKGKH